LNADPLLSTLPWSIHIAESPAESDLMEQGTGPFAEMFERRGITWSAPRMTPTDYAASMGALRPSSLAVHCVHQTLDDMTLVRDAEASIVHCPKSNAKLAAGVAPLQAWLSAGTNVALGTDSAVSNNTLDMFEEMRFAVFGQRAGNRKVEGVTAVDIVRIATLGGAKALGIDDRVGTLTLGKRADMIAVDLSRPHSTPASNPYAALVYSSRADDVVMTMCDGRILYDRGEWRTADAPSTVAAARELRRELEKKRNG
jgi:5-methylthioadenosine/S-adenosylhomocysteine deaminase